MINPIPPGHKLIGLAARPAARPGTKVRVYPCVELGPVVTRSGCNCPRKDLRRCTFGHGNVRQSEQCETCKDYQADN